MGARLIGRHRGIYAALASLPREGRVSLGRVRHIRHARPPGTVRIKAGAHSGVAAVLYGEAVVVEAMLYGFSPGLLEPNQRTSFI